MISPQLFNFYINDLLIKLQVNENGSKIQNHNIPIMGYCDDTLLITPILQQLKNLIEVCMKYSKEWLLKYNAKKSVIINCGYVMYKDEDIEVKMDNNRLPVVQANKYLGIMINKKNIDDDQLIEKFNKVQKCFFGLSSFGIKPPGIQPYIKAFLYNTYCKPIGTYGMGILKLKKNTIQQLNIIQNNMIRYTIGIPYKSHIKILLKALRIVDIQTTYLMEKCTTIKLLHRCQICKEVLTKNIEEKNTNWWFYKEISEICDTLNIEPEEVCYYPDRTREKLENNYYKGNENEWEKLEEIKAILNNFNFRNKNKLSKLLRLEWNAGVESELS